MEKFIAAFADVLKPPWNYLMGIAALLLVAAPRLMDFHRSWLDLRLGQAQLQREKLRLEVLKLRIDLQQLTQQQQLPEIARELEKVSTSPLPSLAPPPPSPPPPERRGVLWGILAGHPQLGRLVMLIAEILLAYLVMMFALASVAAPFLLWTEERFGPVWSFFISIVYAALAWLCYKGFVVTRSIRKELKQKQPPQPQAKKPDAG